MRQNPGLSEKLLIAWGRFTASEVGRMLPITGIGDGTLEHRVGEEDDPLETADGRRARVLRMNYEPEDICHDDLN